MVAKAALRNVIGRTRIVAALLAILVSTVHAQTGRRPAIVVVGIDRTAGWNEMTRDAIRTAESALTTLLQPGDVVEIRLISEASWPAANHLGTVRIPVNDVPERRSFQEAAHVRAQRQRLEREFLARLAAAMAEIRERLWSACYADTASTDINGFLQAATERLATYPQDWARKVVVISDFEERRHWTVAADLSTVDEVVLFPLREPQQPAEAAAHLARWTEWLTANTSATNLRVERPVDLPPARRDCR